MIDHSTELKAGMFTAGSDDESEARVSVSRMTMEKSLCVMIVIAMCAVVIAEERKQLHKEIARLNWSSQARHRRHSPFPYPSHHQLPRCNLSSLVKSPSNESIRLQQDNMNWSSNNRLFSMVGTSRSEKKE